MMNRPLDSAAFPDLVAEWAAQTSRGDSAIAPSANDNPDHAASDGGDPLLALIAQAEIAATRLW